MPKRAAHPRIEILATNARGAPNVAAVNVLSAEFQGIKEFDDVYVGLHLSQAQRLVYGCGTATGDGDRAAAHHTAQIAAARERLEELLTTTFKDEPLDVLDYEKLNPFYGQTLAMFAAIFGFISVLIGAIVLFTVTNTMSMAVVERTAEIGTLARDWPAAQRHPRHVRQRRRRARLLRCGARHRGGAGVAWVINHLA